MKSSQGIDIIDISLLFELLIKYVNRFVQSLKNKNILELRKSFMEEVLIIMVIWKEFWVKWKFLHVIVRL